jgi:hypothetical protein
MIHGFSAILHRGSPQWKVFYNKRTSAERANKRIKIDGLLEEGHHHASMMWYIRLFAIISVIHVDAWHNNNLTLKKMVFQGLRILRPFLATSSNITVFHSYMKAFRITALLIHTISFQSVWFSNLHKSMMHCNGNLTLSMSAKRQASVSKS